MKFDRIAICAQFFLNAILFTLFPVSQVVATGAILPTGTVIEYFEPDLQDYFITADPVEQAYIDTGAVGRWQRTGNAFQTGGPNQVCRFFGNANINPATGTTYGPNSHFYTADPAECKSLKAMYTPTAKSWKFEVNDLLTTPAVNGACAAGLVPVYRAYNNGFARGIDSNHRITSNYFAYLQAVAAGSIGEGAVMCALPGPIRRPRGIYAVVKIKDIVNQQQKVNPAITPAQLNAYFDTYYRDLLGNPAIAGLALQAQWDTVNPNPPAAANPYDWSYVDDAFAKVAMWNVQNPTLNPKTIQFIVTAGFHSPQWLLNQIPSCDGLFQSPVQTPPSTCGKATFTGSGEGGGGELPLPWNPSYKTSWQTFLTAFAARFGSNPAFVSIAVAGPTAASAEMILPNDGNTPAQAQFGGIKANAMWRQLLAFHYPAMAAYQNSDQAFIDEWNAAIDMYGAIFRGVTLVATTGNGLPNFHTAGFTIPSAFSGDCGSPPTMDCAAETTILSHFADPTGGGANAKATQTSGIKGSRSNPDANLGIPGVKRLSQSTAQSTSPSAQILGGAQFDTSFSNNPLGEGCTSTFPPNANDTPAGCTIPPTCNAEGCLPVACIPQACLAPAVPQADLAGYRTFNKVPSNDLIPPEQAEYNVLSCWRRS